VDVVSCGKDAVEMVSRHHYDIVFMDCNMPDMSGFEATDLIRQLEGTKKHTKIVALTAHAINGFREKCIASGMDEYLTKPIRSRTLQEIVTRWARPSGQCSSRRADSRGAVSSRGTDSGTLIDTVRLQKLLQMFKKTGKDFVPAVLDPYLKNVANNIPALYAAIEEENFSGVHETAHTLMGGSRNLGLLKISEICTALLNNSTRDNASELVLALEQELPPVKANIELKFE